MDKKEKERWLFCCTSGINRSPTAAKMFENEDTDTMFIGLEDNGIWKVKEQLDGPISWATHIFVMEKEQETFLLSLYPELDVNNLDIPDVYEEDSHALKEELREKIYTKGRPYKPLLEKEFKKSDWIDRMDALIIPLLHGPSPNYKKYMDLMREVENYWWRKNK